MIVNQRNGKLIASFPVEESDQIMLVTDGGQLIRVPVQDISVMGRSTQGVIVFDTGEGERVVSVEHIPDARTATAMKGRRMKILPTTSRSTTARSMKRDSGEEG